MTLPSTGLPGKDPVHIGKAISNEMESLFANAPEPRRSRCRFEFIDGRIQLREKIGRSVQDSLKRLRVELKEKSRRAYEAKKKETA